MNKKIMKKICSTLCVSVMCAALLAGCGGAEGSIGNVGEGGSAGAATGAGDTGQSGSGSVQNLSSTMGRYMEEEAALPEGLGPFRGMSKEADRIRLFSAYGLDLISDNGGYDFAQDMQVPKAFGNREAAEYFTGMAVTPKGHRLVSVYGMEEDGSGDSSYTVLLMQPDGEEKELTELSKGQLVANLTYGQNGYFYLSSGTKQEHKIYQIDPETGDVLYLFTADELPGILTVAGKRLYAGLEGRLMIFDLESKEPAEDSVLEEFLKPYLTGYSFQETLPFLFCQGTDGDSIYVTVRDGLYRHVTGGSVMEQVIDGDLCSIGDISKLYVGMTVAEKDGTDVFYILYSDGKLMRYTYDESQPTVPDIILRVYSLYDNEDIRLAVSAYQAENPDCYVKYEVGVVEESGQLKEDALKALSTELAAGKGPDVLVMDDLPYESYVEKGVLADLAATASGIGGEGLFENILKPFREDGKLYSIPMVFSVPVICGTQGTLADVATLDQLAGLLESSQKKDGGLLAFYGPQSLLELLSMASSSAWVKTDGSLDRDALTEFLTQCRRIYENEMNGTGAEAGAGAEGMDDASENRAMGIAKNRINTTLNYAAYTQRPFALGSLTGKPNDLAMMLSCLEQYGMDYRLMPGQGGNTFNPSCMLSLNSAGAYREQAEAFIRFAVSADFQSQAGLGCTPVNKAAFGAKQAFPYVDQSPDEPYMQLSSSDDKGNVQNLEVRWPGTDQFAAFGKLVDSLDTCGSGDSVINDAVLEFGPEAVTGEKGIEETVAAIEEKVRLYLAE